MLNIAPTFSESRRDDLIFLKQKIQFFLLKRVPVFLRAKWREQRPKCLKEMEESDMKE